MFRFCSVWFRVFSVETPFQPQNTPNKKEHGIHGTKTRKNAFRTSSGEIFARKRYLKTSICVFSGCLVWAIRNPRSQIPLGQWDKWDKS